MIRRIIKQVFFFFIVILVILAITEFWGRRTYRYDISLIRNPDHRPIPNTPENNSDGLRIKKEAEEFNQDDLNIIFLGDSFVYGLKQYPETSFPYQYEQMARSMNTGCEINVANFGWVSSSPYLSLRFLKDIGKKYSPDVVFLGIDMSDFHDDLKYRYLIEKPTLIYKSLSYFPGIIVMVKKILVKHQRRDWLQRLHEYIFDLPADRFFIVNKPLHETEKFSSAILKTIPEIAAFTENELNAKFILVIFPRSFQYSAKESPKNWERHQYKVLGQYTLEPFVLFDKFKDTVNFPIYSLLKDFQNTDIFPTVLYDDPHWTEKGHKIVAERIYEISKELGIFPCNPGTL